MNKIDSIKTKILAIRFSNPITVEELPAFRSSIIEIASRKSDLLHNHTEEGGSIYQYPLIQYKRINGKAALICFLEGTEAINEFIKKPDWKIDLYGRPVELLIESLDLKEVSLGIVKKDLTYSINNWLPLNQKNFQVFISQPTHLHKKKFLERILIGNILAAYKGLKVYVEEEVLVDLRYFKVKKVKSKGVELLQFNIKFSTNAMLYPHIGIGKQVSKGFGVVEQEERYHKNSF